MSLLLRRLLGNSTALPTRDNTKRLSYLDDVAYFIAKCDNLPAIRRIGLRWRAT